MAADAADLLTGPTARTGTTSSAELPANDELEGGPDHDSLEGEGDDHRLLGGTGVDAPKGGPGSDLCHGGGGPGTFADCDQTIN